MKKNIKNIRKKQGKGFNIKEEIFGLIHEGLDSRDFETRHSAKIFADSIKRTSKILKEEKTKHLKDDGKRYLQQLVFMTKYLIQNPALPIEKRMKRIAPKLKELENHQIHQIYVLSRLEKKTSRTGKKKKTKSAKSKSTKRKAPTKGKKAKGIKTAKAKKRKK
jgi:hypothetical protein